MGPRDEIILIGPVRSGKSTVGRLLAEHLGLPQCSMDDLCEGYYAEIRESCRRERERLEGLEHANEYEAKLAGMAPLFAHAARLTRRR